MSTRDLIEHAVRVGRRFQSDLTGCVQLSYHTPAEDAQHGVPLYENFLFALALLRSRQVDHAQEAMRLLERLLHFQGVDGSFPTYLHQYPECPHTFIGAEILPVLYWIQQLFGGVLGQSLRERLHDATEDLLDHQIRQLEELKVPDHVIAPIAAVASRWGELHDNEVLTGWGDEWLERVRQQIHPGSLYSPSSCAQLLVALQLRFAKLEVPGWEFLWEHLYQTWHCASGSYIGPGLYDLQWKGEAEPTLYDCYLSVLTESLPSRLSQELPQLLQAALVQPAEERLPVVAAGTCFEGLCGGRRYRVQHEAGHAYSVLERPTDSNWALSNGQSVFRLVWEEKGRARSFVIQGGSSVIDWSDAEQRLVFDCTLPPEINVEERLKAREFFAFCDASSAAQLRIDGVRCNSLPLGQEGELTCGRIAVGLRIDLTEGSGRFMTHLHKLNRPSQRAAIGKERFNAYDWALITRTLAREGACRLRVELGVRDLASEEVLTDAALGETSACVEL